MKYLLTFVTILFYLTSSAIDGRIEKYVDPIHISAEFTDSTVHADSCRFYLEVSDWYNPNEIDSLVVSIFYNDSKSFPHFKFFNLLTDSVGKAQLTYLPGQYYVSITKSCTPDFEQNFKFKIDTLNHSLLVQTNIDIYKEGMMLEYDKPVIYCYPEKEMDVEIKLTTDANLTFTYPQLDESWKTRLFPNGDIKVNGKLYPYLFWEGKMEMNDISVTNEGFIVNSKNAITFFENKLTHIGLNQREITDFITYWCPKMNADNYQVQFLIGSDYNENIGRLAYSIQPDTEIRVFALIKEYQGGDFKEQTLPTIQRRGFTVVEWGGSIVPKQLIKL